MAEPASITKRQLIEAVCAWHKVDVLPEECWDAAAIGRSISHHQLEHAIMPGVRPARTFEAGFTEVFGQQLDGKPIKQRKAAP